MVRPITSLEGFVRKISRLSEQNKNSTLLFRGHSKLSYEVKPSVFRTDNLTKSEHLMIRQMLAQQPREFFEDDGIFDQLVRAQHYGLPTRLLDVSYNPLVALYFACCSNPKSNGKIVVLKPEISKQKYFDSDVVSCLAALALMKHDEKNAIRAAIRKSWADLKPSEYFKKASEKKTAAFNDSPDVQKLVQLVRQEKPDFRPIIQPIDLVRPVSVVPRKLHARITAQNGAFVLFGIATRPTQRNMEHIHVETFNIDSERKSDLMSSMSLMGISDATLFPEIERTAIQIKNRYS